MRRRLRVVLLLSLLSAFFVCNGERNNRRASIKAARARVTNGADAPKGRFPYMCSLRTRGARKHKCGAVLINPFWVLTAAHCVDPEFPNSVGMFPVIQCGVLGINEHNDTLSFDPDKVVVHESWKGVVHKGYDVALIKLDKKARIPLPDLNTQKDEYVAGQLLAALGWGKTTEKAASNVLQFTRNLLALSLGLCKLSWPRIIKKHMICAGLTNSDTCDGDSGGPLAIVDAPLYNLTAGNPSKDLIVGISSFGDGECDGSSPGVYTSVGFFSEWIKRTINNKRLPVSSSSDKTKNNDRKASSDKKSGSVKGKKANTATDTVATTAQSTARKMKRRMSKANGQDQQEPQSGPESSPVPQVIIISDDDDDDDD